VNFALSREKNLSSVFTAYDGNVDVDVGKVPSEETVNPYFLVGGFASGHFSPEGRSLGTPYIGGRMGPRVGLDDVKR
jgi:hypothetical protein